MSNDTSARRDRPHIVIVSEVSVGYGTPQVLRVAESLARECAARVTVFEPDQPERPPIDIGRHVESPSISVRRIYTAAHPYRTAGRIEYCLAVASELNSDPAAVIIICSSYGLPVLYRVDASRTLNVFYCLEHVPENKDASLELVARHCSVVIFPERNRAQLYWPRLGGIVPGQQVLILMNANYPKHCAVNRERVSRLFYGGTFHREMTHAEMFLQPEIAAFPIDVYGIIDGFPDRNAVIKSMQGETGGLTYCGYLESDATYFNTLAKYQYSLVIWNPSSEQQLYAAPNKMFDAIACGVPPICAPHPQCVEILQRWGCGVLLDDWTAIALKSRLRQILDTFGTSRHQEMVSQCYAAMEGELSWGKQCEPLVQRIRLYLQTKQRGH